MSEAGTWLVSLSCSPRLSSLSKSDGIQQGLVVDHVDVFFLHLGHVCFDLEELLEHISISNERNVLHLFKVHLYLIHEYIIEVKFSLIVFICILSVLLLYCKVDIVTLEIKWCILSVEIFIELFNLGESSHDGPVPALSVICLYNYLVLDVWKVFVYLLSCVLWLCLAYITALHYYFIFNRSGVVHPCRIVELLSCITGETHPQSLTSRLWNGNGWATWLANHRSHLDHGGITCDCLIVICLLNVISRQQDWCSITIWLFHATLHVILKLVFCKCIETMFALEGHWIGD